MKSPVHKILNEIFKLKGHLKKQCNHASPYLFEHFKHKENTKYPQKIVFYSHILPLTCYK